MADRPHLWPPDATVANIRQVRERASDLGLTLCNINGFMMRAKGDIHHPSWIEADEEKRLQRKTHTMGCIELAHQLEIPFVSTEPGGPLDGMDPRTARALFVDGLEEPVALASSLGVRLLIEPEPGLLLEGMAETAAFVHQRRWEALGVNFDLGHFFCIDEDPAAVIRAYPDRLLHLHIEDIASDRVHRHLVPGEGAMDFASIFEALHEVAYDGFVTVELYPYEKEPRAAAEKAYGFLKPYVAG